jgi:hypothetical protein
VVTELIRKLPEPWQCSLIKAEPKLSRATVGLHKAAWDQPEGAVEVGQF